MQQWDIRYGPLYRCWIKDHPELRQVQLQNKQFRQKNEHHLFDPVGLVLCSCHYLYFAPKVIYIKSFFWWSDLPRLHEGELQFKTSILIHYQLLVHGKTCAPRCDHPNRNWESSNIKDFRDGCWDDGCGHDGFWKWHRCMQGLKYVVAGRARHCESHIFW